MKKILVFFLLLVFISAAAIAWLLLGPATDFNGNKKPLYISSGAATKQAVLDSLEKNGLIKNISLFTLVADRLHYWQKIKPGKYDIKKGTSIINIVRMLRNGQQTPVNLVITKLRTTNDLARLVGNKFECDSVDMARFLNSPDSLQPFDTKPEIAMSVVLPDTYTFFWNTRPANIYKKLAEESKKFWTNERIAKAQKLQLDPTQVYTLASIVDEESNALPEKGNIASVYLNRLKKGMPLQADPTIRFALNDFTIKRIYGEHLNVASPYNTYKNAGLPPGPICTPSKQTIDAILNAPQTQYLYFVADSSFNGRHVFSVTYPEHMQKAKWYQEAFKRRFTSPQ